jgi:hypothetical protein
MTSIRVRGVEESKREANGMGAIYERAKRRAKVKEGRISLNAFKSECYQPRSARKVAHLWEPEPNCPRHLDPSIPISSSSQLSPPVEPILSRRIPQDRADLVDLIDLALPRKQRLQVHQLRQDRPERPHVHRRSIVSRPKQHLGRTIPSRRDVLSIRRLRFDLPSKPKVGKLDDDDDVGFHPSCWLPSSPSSSCPISRLAILLLDGCVILETDGGDEEVLRLHVTVEVARAMDVFEPRDDLVEDGGDETTSERTAFPGFGELVQVALHAFKDEVELFGGLEEGVVEGNDVRVRRDRA